MLSADDMRHFLAVARTGRLVLAAAELRVDHTTVGRRITALERAVGHRLFDRTPEGWRLTERGQRLLEPAESIERALLETRELVDRGRSSISGSVRILCPDGFGSFLLAPALGALSRDNPGLTVEMATATVRLGQTVRDFDVAVTLEEPRSSKVVTRPLSDYLLKVYASRDYLAQHGPIGTVEDLHGHTTIWYVDQLLDVQPLHAVDSLLPGPAAIQSTNVVAHWQAVAAGIGVGPLPQYIARQDPRLVRVLPHVEYRQRYWLVTPRQHARLSRVRLVAQLLQDIVTERAEDLLGPG
ncbi:LysR family transcriptional regulator [Cellulomonas sp. Sa3CUA2]|uniref:LysR family transcriptional regulator n=1 Tax=Cellulomonas avistercoris TaxID=2762242 RepID=A0ABR8QGP6_9CELL|nr:LysR family transcriptional regulator [Cellulomonas avistercoris]MBD7919609.1 LysR family transcriptional regulator [Cellulomonas avistercoris]